MRAGGASKKARLPTTATLLAGAPSATAQVGARSTPKLTASAKIRVPFLDDPMTFGFLNSNDESTYERFNPYMTTPHVPAHITLTIQGNDTRITGLRVFRAKERGGGFKDGKGDFTPLTFNSVGPDESCLGQGSLRGPRGYKKKSVKQKVQGAKCLSVAIQTNVSTLHEVHVSSDSSGSNWKHLKRGSKGERSPSHCLGSKRSWDDDGHENESDSDLKRLRGEEFEVACNEGGPLLSVAAVEQPRCSP